MKSTTPISKIKTEFSLEIATSVGGIKIFLMYLEKIKLAEALQQLEGQSRLCLNAVLRAGNTHSSTDASSFLNQTFELLGDHPVKYARFDKGFGGEAFPSQPVIPRIRLLSNSVIV